MLTWSHSSEAYEAVRQNIHKQDKEWLETIYAEWKVLAHFNGDSREWDHIVYNEAIESAKLIPEESLVDFIWEKTEQLALCDSTGHNADCCPYGCGIHTVPMS